MRAQLIANPDAGARVVSDQIHTEGLALDAYVLFVVFDSDSSFWVGLGDGSLLSCPPPGGDLARIRRIDLGALPLCAAAGVGDAAVVVGTDGGAALAIGASAGPVPVGRRRDRWVESIAGHPVSRLRAWAAGREVVIADASGVEVQCLADHPSTVTGLAFSPDGERLAAAHYDGVSIWEVHAGTRAQSLYWHGSHTTLAWSPSGAYIVTATQDRELHGWRLADAKSLKMTGYPAKVRSLSWTADSRYLAAAGADSVTAWCFDGEGPLGRAPLELGYVYDSVVTRVAAHPQAPGVLAAGFDNGTVLIGDIEQGDAIIAAPPGAGAVTSLAWAPSGDAIVAGSEDGRLLVLRIADAALTQWSAGRAPPRLN